MALEECASCFCSPDSHIDRIHSIILCFSETEPYLNFLSIEEIEDLREKIINGSSININTGVFKSAEEAYSAVKSNNGPKAIQYFSTISLPIIAAVVVISMLASLFI